MEEWFVDVFCIHWSISVQWVLCLCLVIVLLIVLQRYQCNYLFLRSDVKMSIKCCVLLILFSLPNLSFVIVVFVFNDSVSAVISLVLYTYLLCNKSMCFCDEKTLCSFSFHCWKQTNNSIFFNRIRNQWFDWDHIHDKNSVFDGNVTFMEVYHPKCGIRKI